jgi:hypothetical protein
MIRFNTPDNVDVSLKDIKHFGCLYKKNDVDNRHLCYKNVLGHLAVQD